MRYVQFVSRYNSCTSILDIYYMYIKMRKPIIFVAIVSVLYSFTRLRFLILILILVYIRLELVLFISCVLIC